MKQLRVGAKDTNVRKWWRRILHSDGGGVSLRPERVWIIISSRHERWWKQTSAKEDSETEWNDELGMPYLPWWSDGVMKVEWNVTYKRFIMPSKGYDRSHYHTAQQSIIRVVGVWWHLHWFLSIVCIQQQSEHELLFGGRRCILLYPYHDCYCTTT